MNGNGAAKRRVLRASRGVQLAGLRPAAQQRGFTYLGILFAVAFIGVGLAAVGQLWSVAARRADEQDLLTVGDTFRRAIASYYRAGPAGVLQYPFSLEDLVLDTRTGTPVRHLRKIYADPITRAQDWEVVRLADGAIIGVASSAQERPIKRAHFTGVDADFEGAECYCDWRFLFLPELQSSLGQQRSNGLVPRGR